jgi:D-glycero-alpha-D-manno-heptose-7-phosphate kinase
MRPALERSDWQEVGKQVADEWENRKGLAPGVTTPAIDAMLQAAKQAGAWSGKVCGAGGGGCLFCIGPPEAIPAIAKALQSAGARVLDCRIEHKGLTVDTTVVT